MSYTKLPHAQANGYKALSRKAENGIQHLTWPDPCEAC